MWLGGVLAAVILLLSSCEGPTVYRVDSPKHHPPGHAYGNKHLYGYDLVYDSACGMYVVVGLTDYYYEDGFFYRLRGGVWELSVRADEWRAVTYEKLPSRLKVKARSVTKIDNSRSVKPNNSLAKVNSSPVKPNGKGPVKLSGNTNGKPISLASNAESKAKGLAKGKH
jgi:hypothetical protein